MANDAFQSAVDELVDHLTRRTIAAPLAAATLIAFQITDYRQAAQQFLKHWLTTDSAVDWMTTECIMEAFQHIDRDDLLVARGITFLDNLAHQSGIPERWRLECESFRDRLSGGQLPYVRKPTT